MTQLKLSKIGKVVVAVTYIALIVFLARPLHTFNPINWLKIISIIAFIVCHIKLLNEFDESYLFQYIVSFFVAVSVLFGLLGSFSTEPNPFSFVGLMYLIASLCACVLSLLTDMIAIITILMVEIDIWIDKAGGVAGIILKLPLVNILFEQPSKKVKIDEDESTKKVKM